MRVRQIDDVRDPTTGRYHYKGYQAHPFYVKPRFWNRWGADAWLVWVAGGDVPGTRGDTYLPQGFKFEELGPKGMIGKGAGATMAWEEKLAVDRPNGCPFAFAR